MYMTNWHTLLVSDPVPCIISMNVPTIYCGYLLNILNQLRKCNTQCRQPHYKISQNCSVSQQSERGAYHVLGKQNFSRDRSQATCAIIAGLTVDS